MFLLLFTGLLVNHVVIPFYRTFSKPCCYSFLQDLENQMDIAEKRRIILVKDFDTV